MQIFCVPWLLCHQEILTDQSSVFDLLKIQSDVFAPVDKQNHVIVKQPKKAEEETKSPAKKTVEEKAAPSLITLGVFCLVSEVIR